MMTRKAFVSALALTMWMGATAHAQQQQTGIFSAAGNWGTLSDGDKTKPVARGYIVANAEPAVGGAKLIVDVYQTKLDSPVRLSLFAAINTGTASYAVPIKLLENGTPDKQFFIQRHEFFLSYAELDQFFATNAPNAPGLRAEPGAALAVKADFLQSGHNWGGFDRGGVFYLPTPLDHNGRLMVELNKPKVLDASAPSSRATALDVAYPITQELVNTFNNAQTKSGLKLGGQVRSRVEGEGKYQLTPEEYLETKKRLFALANDPAEQARIFGPGWTLKPETRYYKKDAAGTVLLDKHGLPIPDPMVDTYYDNSRFQAASNDMAIRYRWTEGNQTGSWNFKPDGGRTDKKSGVVYRVEYGLDTTDDKPQTIGAFVDSANPLNPFQVIREKIPGAKPSDFLIPSVKVQDTRHKFKLQGPNNLIIEISTDQVHATNLRDLSARAIDYHQIEMDIDHLSTASQNIAQVKAGVQYDYGVTRVAGVLPPPPMLWVYNWEMSTSKFALAERANFLANLKPGSFIDGRPVLHKLDDLAANSPILISRASDFNESARVISALRDHAIGPKWRPAPQKYALAAAALDMIPNGGKSPSTHRIADMVPQIRFVRCEDLFAH